MAGDRGVRTGRDAVGNVIPTGDHNTVEAHVTATKREAPVADPVTVDLAKELVAIRARLTGMESEHTKKIGRALDDADEEAGKKTTGSKKELGKALNRALTYVKSASAFATPRRSWARTGRTSWHGWGQMDDAANAPGVSVSRNSSIVVGRDALGNVFVTDDGNTVEVKLAVVVAGARLQAAAVSTRENPYRGLYAFRETDSELFFGRDHLKTQLRIRLHALLQRGDTPRLLPILGPSGTGKSSLVRAGLLPELVHRPMDGLHNPKVLVLRPGADPVRELAKALAQFAATNRESPKDLGPVTSADFVHHATRSLGLRDRPIFEFTHEREYWAIVHCVELLILKHRKVTDEDICAYCTPFWSIDDYFAGRLHIER